MVKKILFLMALSFSAVFAATDYSSLVGQIGAGAGAGGAAVGIAWIHATFWGKIFAFLLPVGVIFTIYMMKLESKDRGWGKLTAFSMVGIVIGILFYTALLNVEDALYTKDGCATQVSKAYLQDAVRTGLNPSTAKFGDKILATGCFN